jgi:hypothetical protein
MSRRYLNRLFRQNIKGNENPGIVKEGRGITDRQTRLCMTGFKSFLLCCMIPF